MISVQTALLRLGLALLLGALVGFERERGERAAGLRTHALVALGSCLVMIVSAFGFADILGTHNVVLDPSRIAAQVVSGVGFLGAGTILLRKEIIKGLTTAAAIWVVAAIGLACGAGLLIEAILSTVFTIAVLTLLQPLRHQRFSISESKSWRNKRCSIAYTTSVREQGPAWSRLSCKRATGTIKWSLPAQRMKQASWQSPCLP
jgi:putative Mg2+ transporter-C (MgtC) family protein